MRDYEAGRYLYAGSAKKNFNARIARHLSNRKKLRWHIDYLLVHPEATVEKVWCFSEKITECDIVEALIESGCATAPVSGFGSSDCRCGCPAHLLTLTNSCNNVFNCLEGEIHRPDDNGG